MLLVAGASFWGLGQRRAIRRARSPSSAELSATNRRFAPAIVQDGAHTAPLVSLSSPGHLGAALTRAPSRALRLTNTGIPLGRLARSSHAILLENAWLDTSQFARSGFGGAATPMAGAQLAIPAQLRAQGDPGAYVVQSRGLLDDRFRALLQAAGAGIVSYIPNNAYLVRASASAARQLAADPHTQAVLPYEPYYKLQPSLLDLAVAEMPLPAGSALNVLLFPDTRATALADLNALGLQVLSEERSPFGPVLKVRAGATPAGPSSPASPADILSALAGLPSVQRIELPHPRVLATDLSRARIAVAADSVTPDNYLGLTGSNVLVNVNDSGVDATHPDLTNRVYSDLPASSADTNGHGTHVAGIIAGSGFESITVTNASGSVMPAADFQFRGLAPAAQLFVMAADPNAGPSSSDAYLQETAARTNALISNNSWHYGNDTGYDLAAASYDAAARDALPE